MRAQFIVSLFNDDFDEALFEKIKQAYKDSPVRPNSYLIASSFELIIQSIIDIASLNHQLQRGLKLYINFCISLNLSCKRVYKMIILKGN